ncbi:MAG: hypothetical protein N3D16_04695 [Anaerolineales bacterium]|nr:hypothetical protein [Anaerolineales bacterium]
MSCIYKGVEDEEQKPTLSFVFVLEEEAPVTKPMRSGDLCPKCHSERLDYDGTLTLVCPKCGVLEGGCFT